MERNPQLDRIEEKVDATARHVALIDRLLRGGHGEHELGLKARVVRLEDRHDTQRRWLKWIAGGVVAFLADLGRRLWLGG